MPTTRKTAEKILSAYKGFPSTYRPSQEDIIRTLRGETIRGKSFSEMHDKQIYSIARRLYIEAQDHLKNLETKVEKPQEQLFLFDPINPH